MNKQQAFRNAVIDVLALEVVEKAQTRRGGSAALVPSQSSAEIYRVDVDENYNPVACTCLGGKYNCKHKQATSRYFAPKLDILLNNDLNPKYGFERNGIQVVARLSQFSKEEKAALRAWKQEASQENARRVLMNSSLYDVNMVA